MDRQEDVIRRITAHLVAGMIVIESSWLEWARLDRNGGTYIVREWRAQRVGRDDLDGFSMGFIKLKPANDQ